MRTLLRSLVIIIFVSMLSLTACSKKGAVKKDASVDKKEQKKTTTAIKTHKAIKESTIVKKTNKTTTTLNSEELNTPVIKKLTSIKKDEQAEQEAIDVRDRQRELQKIYFDFDRSDIREDAKTVLIDNSEVIKAGRDRDILIEGHCDERGTEEYNLALGQRRAESVKNFLVSLGISDTRMSTISYGEAKPEAKGRSESTWSQNRRAVLKEINE